MFQAIIVRVVLFGDYICVFQVAILFGDYICVFQVAICICAGLDGQNALSGDSSSDCSKGRGGLLACLQTPSFPCSSQNISDRQQLFENIYNKN